MGDRGVARRHGNRNSDDVEGNRLRQDAEAEGEGDQRGIDRRTVAAYRGTGRRFIVMRGVFRRLTMLVQRAHLSWRHAIAAQIVFDRGLRSDGATGGERRHGEAHSLKQQAGDSERGDVAADRGHELTEPTMQTEG